MFWTVFTFELAYWFKRPLTLLFFALFFLISFFSTASDAFLGIDEPTKFVEAKALFIAASLSNSSCASSTALPRCTGNG